MKHIVKDRFGDFTKYCDYIQKLECVKSNPTIPSLRKLYYDGFAQKVSDMMIHHPFAFKMAREQNLVNDISKLIDNAKNSCKWKILDDLEAKEA